MIVINVAGIGEFLFKLLATILIISVAMGGCLSLISVDIEKDEGVLGFLAGIAALGFAVSIAGLALMVLIGVICFIWS
jgi:hypothetical protein